MKTMKNFIAIAAALGALAASGSAMAGLAYTSGTECHNMFQNQANFNTYSNDGVRSINPGQQWIICPVQVSHSSNYFPGVVGPFTATPILPMLNGTRTPAVAPGADTAVANVGAINITATTGTKAIGCTLYSISQAGAVLGTLTVTIPAGSTNAVVPIGPTVFASTVAASPSTFTTANSVVTTLGSTASLVCNLPPPALGVYKIVGIESNF